MSKYTPVQRGNWCETCNYKWITQGIPQNGCPLCGDNKHIKEYNIKSIELLNTWKENTRKEIIDYEPELITHRDMLTGELRTYPATAYFHVNERLNKSYYKQIGLI